MPPGLRAYRARLSLVALFVVAMAYVEAAVVVYLRELYYPGGFTLPLKLIPLDMIAVELGREVATIVMLLIVAVIAGRRFWERFGYFCLLFGVWDIFYYIWLKVAINWPVSLLDWDVLFLIPVPWIGPVIAPIAISVVLIICGVLIIRLFARDIDFKPSNLTWVLAIVATAVVLFTFMCDTGAAFRQQLPGPYRYTLFLAGLVLYIIAFVHSYRRAVRRSA